MNYFSDIVVGQRYRCRHTGFTGAAISITFYEHDGTQNVVLRRLESTAIQDFTFNAKDIEPVKDSGATGFIAVTDELVQR